MHNKNVLLNIHRLPHHMEHHYELKDPSIVQLEDGRYMMYASVGNSVTQSWIVGRFIASDLFGEWQELAPVTFHNLVGPQLCAPAVTYELQQGQPLWTMYIQTACFEENGVIALATSTDGEHFHGQPQPLATRESVANSPAPVIGVYDVGVSEVNHNGEEILCMLYSGYRRIGCGDLYLSTKKKHENEWSVGNCLVPQEQLPFHNHPDYEHFEWGLEGAKIVQLREDLFLLIGVCFLPLPHGYLGTRQRVFFAAADSINGPFKPVGLPFRPQENERKTGENGHPDTMIIGDQLVVIYQERSGDAQPWHLRAASYKLHDLQVIVEQKIAESHTEHHAQAGSHYSQQLGENMSNDHLPASGFKPALAFTDLEATLPYHL